MYSIVLKPFYNKVSIEESNSWGPKEYSITGFQSSNNYCMFGARRALSHIFSVTHSYNLHVTSFGPWTDDIHYYKTVKIRLMLLHSLTLLNLLQTNSKRPFLGPYNWLYSLLLVMAASMAWLVINLLFESTLVTQCQ